MKKIILSVIFSSVCSVLFAQDSIKVCHAARVSAAPKIDGVLDDAAWNNAVPLSDFVMSRPTEGGMPSQKTEVRVVYDDRAVYVSAMLYDTNPDSILHELGNRDDYDLNADAFRFVIDPYNLRQDAFDFGVNAAGVQADSKFSDYTFNAVWKSAVKINDKGWCVEMEIPLSAIRFPKKPVQEWAVQFT
ncbi:MAG TPA: carbohydrate binding family 9 domain-containing protein, partial [Bacteroidia bacterium]|nr:carbohydrate binding family 9 domain-containing protein [Bacteroidia bacterium]